MANRLVVEEPNEIVFTLTMSMTLVNWRKLSGQLKAEGHQYPARDFMNDIYSMISQAESRFYPQED